MEPRVAYELKDGIATIRMDDGKVNALSLPMLGEINAALDRAFGDDAAVVLTGREGLFSAGFDLKTVRAGGADAAQMLQGGFELAARLLTFPRPVVIACGGHAIAMGLFVVMSGDYRIGTSGTYRITANEVAIGMTMPRAAIAICRGRLAPSYLHRVVALAEPFAPADAVTAGLLDEVVALDDLAARAAEVAGQLAALDRVAHVGTKARLRAGVIAELRAGMDEDASEWAAMAQ